MAAMDAGWLSLLPPAAAILLALLTKQAVLSLAAGGLLGALVYCGGNVFGMVDTFLAMLAQALADHAEILLFLALLGSLVAVVTRAGGARGYGEWAAKRIKTRAGAQMATAALGALIFMDDYFNCLTVGAVMRPVTDAHGVPREKLAYLMDATAAPVCILAPVSTWAAAVASQLADGGAANGMAVFLQAIPYNLYAWLTLLMVAILCVSGRDFGRMAVCRPVRDADALQQSSGRVSDLLVPIFALMVCTVAAMAWYGAQHAAKALATGGFCALAVSFLLFVPRRRMSMRVFFEEAGSGVAAMTGAVIILALAWTLSSICAQLLGAGAFVGQLLSYGHIPLTLLPAVVFLTAGGLSFALGTSWGTFGILLPIVMDLVSGGGQPALLAPAVAATLAGAVFGDHCSPLSDTTILSSAGAECSHLAHVATQLPYALLAGGCCLAGYGWMAFGWMPQLALPIAAALLCGALAWALRIKKAAPRN